jgi:hypothetical protein
MDAFTLEQRWEHVVRKLYYSKSSFWANALINGADYARSEHADVPKLTVASCCDWIEY